jgi:hypothetical protein
MTHLNNMTVSEYVGEIAKMVEPGPDLQLVMHHIRLSRLKLGSVLDRLETFEPGPEAAQRLRDHADAIAYEIDTMVEGVRELMGLARDQI